MDFDFEPQSWKSNLIGWSLAVSALFGISLNALVGVAISSQGLLKNPENAIFHPMFSLLIADTINLFRLVQVGIEGAMQAKFVPYAVEIVSGFVGVSAWNAGSFLLVVIAINRYIGICKFHVHSKYFSFKRMKIYTYSSWILAVVVGAVSQILLPCCTLMPHPDIFSLMWNVPVNSTAPNIAQMINEPINAATALCIIISYTLVLNNIKANNSKVEGVMATEENKKRRAQEVRLSVQFIMVSAIYVICFVMLILLATLIPPGMKTPVALFSMFHVINNGINAVIYVGYNVDVQKSLRKLLRMKEKQKTGSKSVNKTANTAVRDRIRNQTTPKTLPEAS